MIARINGSDKEVVPSKNRAGHLLFLGGNKNALTLYFLETAK